MAEQERPDEVTGSEAASPQEPTSEAEPAARRQARRSSRTAGHETAPTAEAATSSNATAESGGAPTVPPAVLRAEQLLDDAILWTLALGSVLGKRVRWLASRGREEVEDLLAEAEAVRSQWRRARVERNHRDDR